MREKAGQCIFAGFPGTELTEEFIHFLEEYKIGNIILFERNVKNCQQLKQLCAQLKQLVLKNTGHLPLIAIDQEGGNIVRLKEDAVNVPGNMAIAASADSQNAYLAGRITGRQLRRVGINLNLAPDLDINSNPDNPVICERSYGDDPRKVAEYGAAMIRGLQEEGILSCAKHFPGHGDTAMDSHLSLPRIEKTLQELEQMELIPFARAVEENVTAIMSAHILFPQLEPEQIPATMSPRIVTELLRKKLGHQGLIFSDCLEMDAILKYYGVKAGAIQAIRAGIDMVFISHTMEYVMDAVNAMEETARKDPEFLRRLETAAEHVIQYKETYLRETDSSLGETSATEEDRILSQRIRRQSFTAVQLPQGKLPGLGEHPFFIGPPDFDSTGIENGMGEEEYFPDAMKRLLGGEGALLLPDQEELDGICRQAEDSSCIVLALFHPEQTENQRKLMWKLEAMGKPLIIVSLRSPFDLKEIPEEAAAIAAWEYSERSFRILAEILNGKTKMAGILPVKL